jgi:hypothetical protein
MERRFNIVSDDDEEEDDDDDDDDDDDEEGQKALEAALAADESEVEEEWVDDDEDVYDEGHEYLEFLAREAAKKNAALGGEINAGGEGGDEDGDEDEDEEDDDDLEEEIYFESPLDELDPYIVFREVFTGLQQHNPASYNELTKATRPEQREFIMHLLHVGEVNAIAAAENSTATVKA